jgi:hypothetical protein
LLPFTALFATSENAGSGVVAMGLSWCWSGCLFRGLRKTPAHRVGQPLVPVFFEFRWFSAYTPLHPVANSFPIVSCVFSDKTSPLRRKASLQEPSVRPHKEAARLIPVAADQNSRYAYFGCKRSRISTSTTPAPMVVFSSLMRAEASSFKLRKPRPSTPRCCHEERARPPSRCAHCCSTWRRQPRTLGANVGQRGNPG